MSDVRIHPCGQADMPAVAAIYAYYVRHSWASFEESPPSRHEMEQRWSRVVADGMPYLIAEIDGVIVGYAYATIYRGRSAYRFTAENSIYIHHEHARRGIGSALLAALIEECEALGCRQMIAVISDTDAGSVPLHTRFGFQPAGTLKSVGFKFGRWIDTLRMQRALGPGDSTPPSARS